MDNMKPIRVVVVDDHPMFRGGVVQILSSCDKFDVVGQGGSAKEAIQLAKECGPNLMLLDISMPGCGLEAAALISKVCPDIQIIMLTASESEENVTASLESGAKGYILKGTSGPELIMIAQSVCNGDSYVTPTLAAKLLTQIRHKKQKQEDDGLSELTTREEEVLDHVSRGLTNKEIARELQLSEKTVKHYMTIIMQKLQVRNRVEAVIQGRRKM
ncbi:MAG: response regulator transcription factor [Hyphomicrobiaceae bacterium]